MKYFILFKGKALWWACLLYFLRTSTCNLRCQWCDTRYTSWLPEFKEISVLEAFHIMHQFNAKYAVITGGEPLIQAEELAQLCEKLTTSGYHITVETNATLFVPVQANLISISPKLSNSVPLDEKWKIYQEKQRLKPEIIRSFLAHYNCQVKFVIDKIEDVQEVTQLAEQIPIPNDLIILMPQSVKVDDVKERQLWLAEACKEKGYRYSPRLHLDIWEGKRGM